ncbi:MAG: hypothetical protein WBI82_01225 [Sphaerochaeta sp.]
MPDSPAFSRLCFGYDRDGEKKLNIGEQVNKICKNTHYSMKRPVELMEAPTESEIS